MNYCWHHTHSRQSNKHHDDRKLDFTSIGHLGDGRMWMVKHPMVTEPLQPPTFKVIITLLSTCMIFKKRKMNL